VTSTISGPVKKPQPANQTAESAILVIGFSKSLRITKPHVGQTVSKERNKLMANQRKRIGPLDTAGSVAVENAKVYKE
jgi:hypothetical protein